MSILKELNAMNNFRGAYARLAAGEKFFSPKPGKKRGQSISSYIGTNLYNMALHIAKDKPMSVDEYKSVDMYETINKLAKVKKTDKISKFDLFQHEMQLYASRVGVRYDVSFEAYKKLPKEKKLKVFTDLNGGKKATTRFIDLINSNQDKNLKHAYAATMLTLVFKQHNDMIKKAQEQHTKRGLGRVGHQKLDINVSSSTDIERGAIIDIFAIFKKLRNENILYNKTLDSYYTTSQTGSNILKNKKGNRNWMESWWANTRGAISSVGWDAVTELLDLIQDEYDINDLYYGVFKNSDYAFIFDYNGTASDQYRLVKDIYDYIMTKGKTKFNKIMNKVKQTNESKYNRIMLMIQNANDNYEIL